MTLWWGWWYADTDRGGTCPVSLMGWGQSPARLCTCLTMSLLLLSFNLHFTLPEQLPGLCSTPSQATHKLCNFPKSQDLPGAEHMDQFRKCLCCGPWAPKNKRCVLSFISQSSSGTRGCELVLSPSKKELAVLQGRQLADNHWMNICFADVHTGLAKTLSALQHSLRLSQPGPASSPTLFTINLLHSYLHLCLFPGRPRWHSPQLGVSWTFSKCS